MRLTPNEIDTLRSTFARHFGEAAQLWLFGSRVDDSKKGGDIDLLVRPALAPEQALLAKIRCLAELERRLGERKIDIVIEAANDPRPIVQIAHATGVRL